MSPAPICNGCGMEQELSALRFVLWDAEGTLIGRFCTDCYAAMSALEKMPLLDLEAAQRRVAVLRALTIKPAAAAAAASAPIPKPVTRVDQVLDHFCRGVTRKGARCSRRALCGHPEKLCHIHARPGWRVPVNPEKAEAERLARIRALERDAVAVAAHPERHTCPDCGLCSYRRREHNNGCSAQTVALSEVEDLVSMSNVAGDGYPTNNVRWNRRGELVVCGRLTHHRPLDMSTADIFGEGYEVERDQGELVNA